MNFSENLLHIRCLLLFFAVGLLTATLSAQTISQNINQPQETEKTQDKDETTDKDETVNKNKIAKKFSPATRSPGVCSKKVN